MRLYRYPKKKQLHMMDGIYRISTFSPNDIVMKWRVYIGTRCPFVEFNFGDTATIVRDKIQEYDFT